MKLTGKFVFILITFLFLTTAGLINSIIQLKKQEQLIKYIYEDNVKTMEMLSNASHDIAISYETLLQIATLVMLGTDSTVIEKRIKHGIQQFEDAMAILKNIAGTGKQEKIEAILQYTTPYKIIYADIQKFALGGDSYSISSLYPNSEKIYNEISILLSSINDMQCKKTKDSYHASIQLFKDGINWVGIISIISISLSIGFLLYLLKSMVRPIQNLIASLKGIAEGEGDLTRRLESRTKDEIADMVRWFNLFMDYLQGMLREIIQHAKGLNQFSEQLFTVSSQLKSRGADTFIKTNAAVSASKQINDNIDQFTHIIQNTNQTISHVFQMIQSISSVFREIEIFSKKSAGNVQKVAFATENFSQYQSQISIRIEEMSEYLNQVKKKTSHAAHISQEADQRASDINQRIKSLEEATEQIGKIVTSIKKIADKTTLLAINAKIEATSAGEAGKGFTVVANEVNELSSQSVQMTTQIREQISQIQYTTNELARTIYENNHLIRDIATISKVISDSVEEQTKSASEIRDTFTINLQTVKNIAQNATESSSLVDEIVQSISNNLKTTDAVASQLDQLSREVNSVSQAISESSEGVEEIYKNIQDIHFSAEETAKDANLMQNSSQELTNRASMLSSLIGRFKL
ncbi:MAG: methyl-accepting chemotaxis protein [Desulfobacterales bacterium]|nr:methyl-accepting chemotaxis protein [Desulfobacterales bacterium]